MIARADGAVILVSGALPDERVTARVERVGKGVAFAETIAVEKRSPDRLDIAADPRCGGCLYAFVSYQRQLALKAEVIADAFARIARVPLPAPVVVAASPQVGYRMRARLHFRKGALGFFREGSHEVCDARATEQLLPATHDVLDRLAARLPSLGLGDSFEIDVSENIDASARVVHLETLTGADVRFSGVVDLDAGVTGLTVGQSMASGIAHATVIAGEPYVTDTLSIDGCQVPIRRHVLSFFQGNRFLLRDLVAHVVNHVNAAEDVVDLYAGVGLFALAAAAVRGARVIAVEGDRIAAHDLDRNAATSAGTVTVAHEAVEVFVARQQPAPHTVIVDPPRTGMSKEALAGAIGLSAGQMVYVSCDVATLARDVRRLVDAGYRVERVDAFDLFPNTPHVETVVVLDKK